MNAAQTPVDQRFLQRLARRAAVPEERERIAVEAPFTGHFLGEVPRGTPQDVRTACRIARTAQPA